jgi:formylglycine-generating enzyme required for sulfatase activity
MSGNVAEWVSDWWDPGYYLRSPNRNPTGPATGDPKNDRGLHNKVVRGRSVLNDWANTLTTYHRTASHINDNSGNDGEPYTRSNNTRLSGFRYATDP